MLVNITSEPINENLDDLLAFTYAFMYIATHREETHDLDAIVPLYHKHFSNLTV